MQQLRDKVLCAHAAGDIEALSLALCLVWKISLYTQKSREADLNFPGLIGPAHENEINN
jgi:hypothetical protein